MIAEGRAAITRVDGICRGGVAWANVYLRAGIGLAQENIDLLGLVAAGLKALGKPFVVAGHWSMEPSELASGNFLNQVRGAMVALSDGTCEPAMRVLDYFAVSAHLCAATTEVWQGWPVTPHWPVCLVVKGDEIVSWERTACGPRSCPWSSGCCSRDYSDDWEAAMQTVGITSSPDAAWRAFIGCAEKQVVDACGATGEVDEYLGRADGLEFKWKQACKPTPPWFP